MKDIWYGGPKLFKYIAQKLSNKFWSEIINIFAAISEELQFAKPFYFFNFNIFDNDLFSVNNIELKSSDFQSLWNRNVCQVGDFFDPNKSPQKCCLWNR